MSNPVYSALTGVARLVEQRVPQRERSLAQFPVRAHAWVTGQGPWLGAHERQLIDVPLTH